MIKDHQAPDAPIRPAVTRVTSPKAPPRTTPATPPAAQVLPSYESNQGKFFRSS